MLEPEIRFAHGAEPYFHWKRVRGVAQGPFSSRTWAKLQVDHAIGRLRVMDAQVDWQAVKGPVGLTFRVGQGYMAWCEDGWAAPIGIDYTFMTEQLRLMYRMTGVQATISVNKRYQANAGVFNGTQSLLQGPNDKPYYLLGGSLIGRAGTLHAWGMAGSDRRAGLESTSWMYGVEAHSLRHGRLFGEAAWIAADRFGKRMNGAYADLGYQVNQNALAFVRAEWCDTDARTPGAIRQRYSLCAQHRLNPWIVAKWDTRYEQGTGHFEGNGQLDVQF